MRCVMAAQIIHPLYDVNDRKERIVIAAKIGRPKIEWEDKEFKQFESLCAIQCTAEEICSVIGGISTDTLTRILKEKYKQSFSECYKRFSAPGKASLRRTQFELAKKNAAMAIWLGKQYLGQRDAVEVTNIENNPYKELTTKQLIKLAGDVGDS